MRLSVPRRFLLLSLVAIVLVSLPGFSQTAQIPANDPSNETSGLWFVELNSAPTADGTSLSTVRTEKTAFRKAAAAAGLKYKERYAFDVLWNGLSIAVAPSQLSTLARLPGVKNIYPVMTYKLDDVVSPNIPDINNAVTMTGADIVQNELGFTGKGVKVAVMDTGLDYMHPDLGGCTTWGSCTRVPKGYDLVGDAYNADPTSPTYNPTPAPDPDPMDCNGHGSHVAGIIGAKSAGGPNSVTGVAPEVTFYAYRVFGCEGSTTDDVMVAAMERVLADGAQVLNMSIGSAFQWPQYPTAQASDRLVNKGVSVVASIGNNGANGLYSAGAPGVGKKVIGVASYDNVMFSLPYFTVSPDATKIGFNVATGAPAPPTSGSFDMAKTGTTTSAADACTALPAGSLAGKVVLIRRGTCSFYIKASNAQAAGAAGVVLYNNTAGYVSPTVAGTPAITIPVVATDNIQGALLDGRIAAGTVTMTWTDLIGAFPNNTTAGLISSFSSYGLAADLSLKPDIGAPGGMIRSTYFSPTHNGYAVLSGTSMASPHTAGAVALLLQARPNTPSNTIRDILQNSGVPRPWWGAPTAPYIDNVNRQGAGMLQIDKSILSTTKIEPGKLALGESQFGPVTSTLTVTNKGDHEVTYDLTYVNALSVANTFTPQFFVSNAAVTFSALSVTIPVGGTATVDVTVTPPTGPNKGQYGGYVVFTDRDTPTNIYRVPYAGFVGDYQSIVALAPTVNGFPWLAKLTSGSYYGQPTGATYTLANGDLPYFLVHFDHQVAALRIQVFDANTSKDWHYAFSENYVGRNSTATGFFALSWDGSTFAGGKTYTVPNGQYNAVLSVLKALGDPNNPADWETWTSPTITIARP